MSVTKEEFHKIYKEQLEPVLKPLDNEVRQSIENFISTRRKSIEDDKKKCKIFVIISGIFTIFSIWFNMLCIKYPWAFDSAKKEDDPKLLIWVSGLFLFVSIILYFSNGGRRYFDVSGEYRKLLKEKIIPKILSLYGKFYFSDSKNAIPLSDIHSMGFFHSDGVNPDTNLKCDDDVIIGTYKGVNILINECKLAYATQKSSETVFAGLILKIQMNKEFKGKTFIGPRWYINRLWKFEPVKLESVELIKNYEVYSTDQIEARYILTPALIDRLYHIVKYFRGVRTKQSEDANIKQVENFGGWIYGGFCAAFIGGYIYIFIQNDENLFDISFEVPLSGADEKKFTLLDESKYYNIYNQLGAILSIIDYLKLDKDLGL